MFPARGRDRLRLSSTCGPKILDQISRLLALAKALAVLATEATELGQHSLAASLVNTMTEVERLVAESPVRPRTRPNSS